MLTGYQCGKVWFKEFVSSYESRYGIKPPVDIWAIDVYPLDWWNTPNSGQHASIAINQLIGMRNYLNSVSEYQNTPIWITEMAVHVGYDGWIFGSSGNLIPVGSYNWDKMSDYLNAVLDWLEQNAASNQIEKWFFFTTWKDIVNVASDGYMGIVFFDGSNRGASLNCLGEIYRARSLGQSPLKCDVAGNNVPTLTPTQIPTPVPLTSTPTATPMSTPIPFVPASSQWSLIGLALLLTGLTFYLLSNRHFARSTQS